MDNEKDALDFAGFKDAGLPPEVERPANIDHAKLDEARTAPTSPSAPETRTPAPQPKGSNAATWFWVAAVVAILIGLGSIGQREGRDSTNRNSPSSGSTPSMSNQNDRGIQFEKPPPGTSRVLSVAQIRWCLREDIRIEANRPFANTDQEIVTFNWTIDDYNSRCANYRYDNAAMQRARREVEGLRSQIVMAARQSARTPTSGAGNAPNPLIVAPPPTRGLDDRQSDSVRRTQTMLSQLGYNPGSADGIYGPRTRLAIEAFQRDNGLYVDGKISVPLKTRLLEAASRGNCDYKRFMTDADYERCGIRPP